MSESFCKWSMQCRPHFAPWKIFDLISKMYKLNEAFLFFMFFFVLQSKWDEKREFKFKIDKLCVLREIVMFISRCAFAYFTIIDDDISKTHCRNGTLIANLNTFECGQEKLSIDKRAQIRRENLRLEKNALQAFLRWDFFISQCRPKRRRQEAKEMFIFFHSLKARALSLHLKFACTL